MIKKIILGLLLAASACVTAVEAQPHLLENGARDKITLTLYSNGMALVRELRYVSLPFGEGELSIQDVANNLIPTTVHVESQSHPDGFQVLEQYFAYDAISPEQLLNRFVGKEIQLEVYNAYQDRTETITATLLSNVGNTPVYQIGDKIYLGHHGRPVLPMTDDMAVVPTLTWLYLNGTEDQHELEVSYLTPGISWSADYHLILDEARGSGLFSGWATIQNGGTAHFPEAQVGLMAGEIQQVSDAGQKAYAYRSMKLETTAAPEAEAFFDYEFFALPRSVSIDSHTTKQVPLFDQMELRARKEYLTDGAQNFYGSSYRSGDDYRRPVQVFVELQQTEGEETPIPAGTLRVYTTDGGDELRWIGEDHLSHTAKGENLRVRVGNAFDIVAEQRQTDYTQLSSKMHRSAWAWDIKNKKDEAVTVIVQQRFSGNWQINDSSHKYKSIDANTVHFTVDVPANGDLTLTYQVQVGI